MADRKQLTCNSFVFYGSFYEAISVLPTENQAHIYDAIFKFAFENIEVELEGVELAVFLLIKPQLIANRARYENGCKGGRPRKENQNETESEAGNKQIGTEYDRDFNQIKTETEPKNNLTETKSKPNENDNENVNDNKKENTPCGGTKEKATRFFAPTLDEVKKYCHERKNSVDAEKFWDFYESKGWMVGKSKMKDWRACVRTWEKESKTQPPTKRDAGFDERKYTAEELHSIVTNIDELDDSDL